MPFLLCLDPTPPPHPLPPHPPTPASSIPLTRWHIWVICCLFSLQHPQLFLVLPRWAGEAEQCETGTWERDSSLRTWNFSWTKNKRRTAATKIINRKEKLSQKCLFPSGDFTLLCEMWHAFIHTQLTNRKRRLPRDPKEQQGSLLIIHRSQTTAVPQQETSANRPESRVLAFPLVQEIRLQYWSTTNLEIKISLSMCAWAKCFSWTKGTFFWCRWVITIIQRCFLILFWSVVGFLIINLMWPDTFSKQAHWACLNLSYSIRRQNMQTHFSVLCCSSRLHSSQWKIDGQ